MTVESKIIVTAEDRTAAAFAAIERNTAKTAMAMLKLNSSMLAMAGAGGLVAFFRSHAQSTEKWRDEMARLDDITDKFFNTAADAGRLDPMIKAVKVATVAALGLGTALEIAGKHMGAQAAFWVSLAEGEFREAGRIIKLDISDIGDGFTRLKKINEDVFKEAPQGFAKHREEEAERVKNAVNKLKKAEEERIKMTLENASQAEEAFRAESELSPGITGAGMEAMVQKMGDDKFAKEQELRLRASEENQKQRDKDIEALLTSQLTEADITNQKYANDLQTLYDARESEYLTEAQFKQARVELEQQHQAKLGDVHAQGAIARRDFEKMTAMQQTQFALDQMIQLTQGVATHNKTMFQINKLATVAKIALGIPLAVQKAYESYPPPFSFIAGAMQLAASLANLNQAKNAQFGSSSSAPSIAGGGAMPTYNAETSVPTLPSTQQAAPAREVHLHLASSSGIIDQTWLRDVLMPSLNEAVGDGVNLQVN